MAAGDLDAVRRRAHQVAGASWLVGAKQVARDANRVESDPADPETARRLLAHRPGSEVV